MVKEPEQEPEPASAAPSEPLSSARRSPVNSTAPTGQRPPSAPPPGSTPGARPRARAQRRPYVLGLLVAFVGGPLSCGIAGLTVNMGPSMLASSLILAALVIALVAPAIGAYRLRTWRSVLIMPVVFVVGLCSWVTSWALAAAPTEDMDNFGFMLGIVVVPYFLTAALGAVIGTLLARPWRK